ncbi:type VII secretion integral membrane protein EccD [Actinoplanes solisilvae]|uniref:type VII secretion integral membrane protein EccD n=1 Tax=Actinoplanes solisilvae TaxID=2486853 RepID=UPI000FDC8ED6|nr:type VII secretion integral membrane protein EccD [Actinoplanes solisilvae]
MTAAMSGALCRITVIGPDRKVDLAVPVTTPVADLLPMLLQHTTTGVGFEREVPEGPWVLQRLGEGPFELSGTPESLDWLEGEQLYLQRAEDPLPELDFDDLAEGVATMVNRRSDRWQAEYRRPLFLVLSAVVLLIVAAAVVAEGPVLPQVVSGAALAAALLAAALVSARKVTDGNFALLFGCGSVFFAALAAVRGFDDQPVLAGAVAAVVISALLLVTQRTVTPYLPFGPMLFVGVAAVTVVLVTLLGAAAGTDVKQTSGAAAAVLFAMIVIAPRVAVKLSRLRGPQLPKTGEDMAYDIEPDASALVKSRADHAETYLTVAVAVAGVLLPVLFHYVNTVPGWSGWTLILLISSAILLRSRSFFGLWQRLVLVAAGVIGYVMVVQRFAHTLPEGARYAMVGVLLALLIPLVMAALRPWPQRMLPFWEYAATFLDVATGVAVLPVLAQVLGVYAWARGLFG